MLRVPISPWLTTPVGQAAPTAAALPAHRSITAWQAAPQRPGAWGVCHLNQAPWPLTADLSAPGALPATGLPGWHSLFGLICGPACLIMMVEMLLSFNMYSGRACHHSHAA